MNKLFKINKLFTTNKGYSLYHLVFKSRYEMAMFYLRYQEFYESINPEFRGKSFTYLDYMSWYTQFTNAHMFTYPRDFIGYNLPSCSINECIPTIPKGDKNKYDKMMIKLNKDLLADSNGKYYIIGTIRKDNTFHHEIAHALYYLEPTYKTQMNNLTGHLSNKLKLAVYNILATTYPEKVFNDELQAYMSTNSWMTGMAEIPGFKVKAKKYEQVFQSWLAGIDKSI